MANLNVLDGQAASKYIKSSGVGTDGDPHIPEHLETNSSAIKTALELIDNTVSGTELQVDIVASLPAGTNAIGKLAANSGVDIGDVDVLSLPSLATGTNTIGKVGIEEKTLVYVTGTAADSGDNSLIAAAGAGVRIVVVSFTMQNESGTATTMIMRDGTTAVHRILGQNQGDGLSLTFPQGREWKLTANTALNLNLSGANSCGYSVVYYTE